MTDLIAEGQRWLLVLALALPRILTVFTVVPLLAEPVLPGLLRNGIAISLAVVILPVVEAQLHGVMPDGVGMLLLIGKEAFLGLLMGYLVSIVFWAVGSVGFLIDTQRGAMSAGLSNLLFGGETSPLGAFLVQAVTTLLFVSGGFMGLLEVLYLSYEAWPVPAYYPAFNGAAVEFFLKQLDLLMYLTVLLAGPALIVMFLVELGIAQIGRFLPQLNVFLLAMPVKSALALLLMVLYMAALLHYLRGGFQEFGAVLESLDGLLR